MTDTSNSGLTREETERFRQIQRERAERQGQAATEALTGRDLETFQRIQRERARTYEPPWETTRLMVRSDELGEPGLPDLDIRASLSFRETPQEREEAFQRAFPMGEIKDAIDERGNMFRVFRRDTAEPWRRVDPLPMEKWEPLQDIADIAGDVPEMVGEAIATRGTGGAIRQGLRAGLGAGAGTLVEETVEAVRGEQRQDLGQVTQMAGLEATAGGFGAFATMPLSGATNALIGARNIGLLPGAHTAIEAESRQNLPLLTPGQLALNPMVRRTATYGETFSGAMQLHVFNQQSAAAQRLQEMNITGASDLPLYTRAGVAAREAELLEMLERPRTSLSRDWAQAGTQLLEGVQEWDTVARLEVDDFFKKAREIEEPSFDMPRLQSAVNTALEQGVRVTDGQARPLDPHNAALERVLRDIGNFDGQPVAVPYEDGEVILSVTDQLRAFRESLWDLKTTDPGVRPGRPEADAAYFYHLITDVLKSPTNDNPAFVAAWAKANEAAARRFEVWDKTAITTILRSQDPDSLARTFVAPGQRAQLQTIKETIPVENWEQVRQSAMQEIFLNNPTDITRQLNRFDTATLTAFMQPREIVTMRAIGEGIDRLAALRELGAKPRWQDMGRAVMNAPDARYIAAAEEIGDKFSPSGMRLRAATLNAVIEEVVEDTPAGTVVNRTKLSNTLQRMRTNGAMEYLTANDMEVLTDIHRYLNFARQDTSDMGASLMGSQQQLSAFREFSRDAMINIAQTIGLGELLISPAGRRLLIGTDAPKPTYRTLRLAGAAIGTLVSTFEEDPEEAE